MNLNQVDLISEIVKFVVELQENPDPGRTEGTDQCNNIPFTLHTVYVASDKQEKVFIWVALVG